MMILITSICSIFIATLSFALGVFIFFSNQRQKRIDNLITLHLFLHKDELSEARRCVRESVASLTLQYQNVRRVCSSFDFAGTLVRHGAVNKKLFFDYWCAPILAIEESLSEIAHKQTGKALKVKDYYKDFWWLIDDAKSKKHIERSQRSA